MCKAVVWLNCAASAAFKRTTWVLVFFSISPLLSPSSLLLTNVSDWGTSTKKLYVSEQEEEIRSNQPWIKVFFSILYHKWQTWIHPSNRCRKLLICSIWLSWLFYIFWLVGWLVLWGSFAQRGKHLLLPLLICLEEWPYCATNTMVRFDLWASGDCYLRKNQKFVIF